MKQKSVPDVSSDDYTMLDAVEKGIISTIASTITSSFSGKSACSSNSKSYGSNATWEYLDNAGWKPYASTHQSIIERYHQDFANQRVTSSKVLIKSDEWTYEVDVALFVQTNTDHAGHRQRDVRRRTV